MSGVISRVHFIVWVLPDISPLLIRTQDRRHCCKSQQGEGGLVMPHGGRTAVNITGFYCTVRCCNQGRAVAPRCLSGFDGMPKKYIWFFFRLINLSVVEKKKQESRPNPSVNTPDFISWPSLGLPLPPDVSFQRTCRSKKKAVIELEGAAAQERINC